MQLELTRRAKKDLAAIRAFGNKRFGERQSAVYSHQLLDLLDLLGAMPFIAPVRAEAKRPLRLHPFRAHLVIYMVTGDMVQILRVLSKQQNWPDHV